MEFSGWLGFLSASIFLAFVPGPDNIFVLLQSATNGFRSGFFVILGLCTGLVFQTLCATLGLAAVVAASTWLFGAICVLGALYLLYIAWGAWHAPIVAEPSARVSSLAPQAAWRRGTLMNITNPKVQIFFLAFFPQFLFEGAGRRAGLGTDAHHGNHIHRGDTACLHPDRVFCRGFVSSAEETHVAACSEQGIRRYLCSSRDLSSLSDRVSSDGSVIFSPLSPSDTNQDAGSGGLQLPESILTVKFLALHPQKNPSRYRLGFWILVGWREQRIPYYQGLQTG